MRVRDVKRVEFQRTKTGDRPENLTASGRWPSHNDGQKSRTTSEKLVSCLTIVGLSKTLQKSGVGWCIVSLRDEGRIWYAFAFTLLPVGCS